MADTKISALTDGTTAVATDRLPVARSPFGASDNRYVTPAYIKDYILGLANTFTRRQTITQGTANEAILASTGYSLTGTDATSMIDLAGTWNTSGTPTAFLMNITNTASNAASKLLDLQVGGVSKVSVRVDGAVTTGASDNLNIIPASGYVRISRSTASFAGFELWTNNFGTYLGGMSGSTVANVELNIGGSDIKLLRDAANTLAQRNSTTAQTFRIYNTFTDASNYERGNIFWAGNVFGITTTNAGTGSARAIELISAGTLSLGTANAVRWAISSSSYTFFPFADNTYPIGTSGNRVSNFIQGGYHDMSEMTAPAAPSANTARIYAVDNGSGKTQLMVIFASGAAQQIAIEP